MVNMFEKIGIFFSFSLGFLDLMTAPLVCKLKGIEVEEICDMARRGTLQFYSDMNECIENFMEKVNDFECEEASYKLDLDRFSMDASDQGSGEYVYPTRAKAKTACMEAITGVLDEATKTLEVERKRSIDRAKACAASFEKMALPFAEEFFDSYDEYMEVDCDEAVQEYIRPMREELFVSVEECQSRLSNRLAETFDEAMKNHIDISESLGTPREYIDLSRYDSDGENYCYELDGTLAVITDDLRSTLKRIEDFPNIVQRIYRTEITAFYKEYRNSLNHNICAV